VGEDLWLGTDPLLDDSDRYNWDGFSVRPLYPSFGDGIPDGWEAHFGLDPLNRSNALLDSDQDGWDANRDGFISADLSRTSTAMTLGEALSTLQEYLVHEDGGNTVYPGLKNTELGTDGDVTVHPLIYDSTENDPSVLHHDIRSLDHSNGDLYVTTRYGVSIIDLTENTSRHSSMVQGVDIMASTLLSEDGQPYAMVMATSVGMVVSPLQADGQLAEASDWTWALGPKITAMTVLHGTDGDAQLLGLGHAGAGMVVEVDGAGQLSASHDVGTGIVEALAAANASVTALDHGSAAGTTLTLYAPLPATKPADFGASFTPPNR